MAGYTLHDASNRNDLGPDRPGSEEEAAGAYRRPAFAGSAMQAIGIAIASIALGLAVFTLEHSIAGSHPFASSNIEEIDAAQLKAEELAALQSRIEREDAGSPR